ncbi:uncharacterized protein LOC123037393 [Drosophila rhopaloa]|uniref:Uncharacterized protein n=1 Tax=Drosophila rhopaloa TaxID=1041015 RepID=A0ABM5J4B2_DRORH|nr:uncharacterized protein LOC123037393 [Drosophila rhopaloa]
MIANVFCGLSVSISWGKSVRLLGPEGRRQSYPYFSDPSTQSPEELEKLWNHKGNMLHMHSPKAICIQMLPTHFKNCTITGASRGDNRHRWTLDNWNGHIGQQLEDREEVDQELANRRGGEVAKSTSQPPDVWQTSAEWNRF